MLRTPVWSSTTRTRTEDTIYPPRLYTESIEGKSTTWIKWHGLASVSSLLDFAEVFAEDLKRLFPVFFALTETV